MARGWGKSEEDQGADREQARQEAKRAADIVGRAATKEAGRRRGIEMSLARIDEELRGTEHPDRRKALEAAKAQLRAQLADPANRT